MSNLLQNVQVKNIVFGAAAVIALILAMPTAPASAQGVPAGLLRLDSSQPSEYGFGDSRQLTAEQQTKVRSAYARVNKKHPAPSH